MNIHLIYHQYMYNFIFYSPFFYFLETLLRQEILPHVNYCKRRRKKILSMISLNKNTNFNFFANTRFIIISFDISCVYVCMNSSRKCNFRWKVFTFPSQKKKTVLPDNEYKSVVNHMCISLFI